MTPGQRQDGRTGIRQVAERAGVAVSSVSRVLSGHPNVSKAMRRRVLLAVADLGYEPDLLAQGLRRGETMTVGFVVGDISNPLLAEIALGAETSLGKLGYSMLLANSQNDPRLDARHISLFRQRRVDGLLLSLADETSEATLQALRLVQQPSVVIDREIDPSIGASAVLSDHAVAIGAAVDDLVGAGHTRIALVTGPSTVRPSRVRADALQASVRRHPGVRAVTRAGQFSAEHGAVATAQLLDDRDPPTALIAGSNQVLVGVLRTLKRRAMSIPDDVSVVTCDDVPLAELMAPGFATIHRDSAQLGREAAALLLRRVEGGGPETRTLPVKYRRGKSVGPPA